MKNVIRVLSVAFLTVWFMGCYKQVPLETAAIPPEIKVAGMDDPAPSQDEADVVISTHLKKASYLLSPRTSDTLYTFTISINGQEFKEDAKGIEEVESDTGTEKGKGVHYSFKKRFRLKPGSHEISLKTEERSSVKVKVDLSGGRIHTLSFEPLYGRGKVGLSKMFQQGLLRYKAYIDGVEVSTE